MSVRKSRKVCPDACHTEYYYVPARSLLRFDLSSIPAGAQVHSATLRLRALRAPGEDVEFSVHAVRRPWAADGATWTNASASTPWQNPGGDYAPVGSATIPFAGSSSVHEWDVTSLARAWLLAPGDNLGMLVRTDLEGSPAGMEFGSSEHSTASYRPMLEILYSTAPDLELGGELVQAAHEPLTGYEYALLADAEDGGSGIRSIEIKVDGASVAYVEDECPELRCELDVDWDFTREAYAPGSHHIVVTATDWEGEQSTATLDVVLSSTTTPAPDPSEGDAIPLSQDTTTPQGGAGPGCREEFNLARSQAVLRYRHAIRVDGFETTAWYTDGSYRVARCDTMAQLERSQLVQPVPVPTGTAMLPTSEVERDESGRLVGWDAVYGLPEDLHVQEVWATQRELLLSDVLPPTQ
jgi:hypothetical protein